MNILKYKKKFFHLFKKKIFIFRIPCEIGDTILSIPALKLIRERHKGCEIVLISKFNVNKGGVQARNLLKDIALINYFLYYSESIFHILFIVIKLKLIFNKELYYLNSSPPRNIYKRDYLFFRLCGFRKINGSSIDLQEFLKINNQILPYGKYKESIRLCKILDINYKFNLKRPLFPLGKEKINLQEKFLNNLDLSNTTIAFGIGGKLNEKKWSIEKYISLIKRITSNYSSTNIVLFGGEVDSVDAEKIVNDLNKKNVVSIAGKTSLKESISIMSYCSFYIGNDCGIMHIASMMGLRCIALFSIHQKRGIWEPFGDDNFILRSNIDLKLKRPVTLKDAKKSMDLIKVDEVYNAYESLFNFISS